MDINDAMRVLVTSVDLHINSVIRENPTDEEFEAYFAPDGWGTAQSNALRTVQKFLKRRGGSKII